MQGSFKRLFQDSFTASFNFKDLQASAHCRLSFVRAKSQLGEDDPAVALAVVRPPTVATRARHWATAQRQTCDDVLLEFLGNRARAAGSASRTRSPSPRGLGPRGEEGAPACLDARIPVAAQLSANATSKPLSANFKGSFKGLGLRA